MSEKKTQKKKFSFIKLRDKIDSILILYLLSIVYVVVSLYSIVTNIPSSGITETQIFRLLPLLMMILILVITPLMFKRKRDIRKIVAIQSFAISLSIFFIYSISMTYGDILQFIASFLASIVCIVMASLSLDLYIDRVESAQAMKPMCLVIIIEIAAVAVLEYCTGSVIFPMYAIFNGLIFLVLLFIYADRRIMKRMKIRDITFPRIKFLAAVMFLFGLMLLSRPEFNYDNSILSTVGLFLMMFTGLFFLVYKWADKITSLAVMSMVIGTYVILSFSHDLFSSDIAVVLNAIVIIIVASLCIIMSILLYAGDRYNTVRLKSTVIIIGILYAVPVILKIRDNPVTTDILNNHVNSILYLFLVASLYLALTDPGVRYYNTKYRMGYNVSVLNHTLCNIPGAFIFRKDLRHMMDETKWRDNDPGAMMREKSVVIHIDDTRSILSIQEWKDTGKITGELAHNKGETYVQTLRFTIDKLVMDGDIDTCTSVTMYDDRGFFTRIMVADEIEGSKVGRLSKFIYLLIGHDPDTGKVAIKKNDTQ